MLPYFNTRHNKKPESFIPRKNVIGILRSIRRAYVFFLNTNKFPRSETYHNTKKVIPIYFQMQAMRTL